MVVYSNKTFDEERALYGSDDIRVENCRFDGPADGESAMKESSNIYVTQSYFNLRYPFWHDRNVYITDSKMTDKCRAALWYSDNIEIVNTMMYGIKGLRECTNIKISDSDILSPEFGWSNKNIIMTDTHAEGEYFMMRSTGLRFENCRMQGKYSFQYISDAEFRNCEFDTKDAFWHSRNVVVKDCMVKGEYLAWYSDNVIFENCTIIGTQPLCYATNLKLINCEMVDADRSFEKTDVDATLIGSIISIKNPRSGIIRVDHVDEIIMDDENAKGIIEIKE